MVTLFPNINMTNIHVLKSNETKFPPNTTVETLVNELFIDNWFTLTSFSNYYTKCEPILCTYTFTKTGNAPFVVTTLTGLLGGLTIVLRFCVFNIVKWWYKRFIRPHEPTTSKLNVSNIDIKYFHF